MKKVAVIIVLVVLIFVAICLKGCDNRNDDIVPSIQTTTLSAEEKTEKNDDFDPELIEF